MTFTLRRTLNENNLGMKIEDCEVVTKRFSSPCFVCGHYELRIFIALYIFINNGNCLTLQEDIKSLTSHIVENYYDSFEGVDYVQTFKTLKQRYEQQQDRMKDRPSLDR